MKNNVEFSPKKLVDIRWERRLRQKQLADKIGVKPAVVCSWEKARHVPSSPMLVKLAQVFDVPIEYFFAKPLSSKNNKKSLSI